MWSDIVERAERDRLMAIPAPGWDLSRMVVNLSVHFLPYPCIECRLLGRAATPPRSIALHSPPLVAVLPDRYKKRNRKHNYYSMTMIWTHKYIQNIYKHTYMHRYINTYYIHKCIHTVDTYIYYRNTYIRTCMHAYIYTDNIATVGHRYNDRFIRYQTFTHTSCSIWENKWKWKSKSTCCWLFGELITKIYYYLGVFRDVGWEKLYILLFLLLFWSCEFYQSTVAIDRRVDR